MNYITQDSLKDLLSRPPQSSVTIYMPTHRASSPPNMQEDMTRYKNQIKKADEIMNEKAVSHDDQQSIMRYLRKLVDDQEFWTHQSDSVAILVDSNGVKTFSMGTNIMEYVAVDERYHLTPLMLQMESNQPYLVLALALHGPKLYEGDASSFKESDVELPSDPESALNIDEMHVKQIQSRGVRERQPNSGNAPAMFHGHGGSPRDTEAEPRHRFFKLIDEVICKRYDDSRPLIIVSTDDQLVEYKSVAAYGAIVDTTIEGNRTHDKPDELHLLTWEAIQQNIVQPKRSKLLEQFEELVAQNRSLTSTEEIQAVATEGRVDTLLVGMAITTTDTVKDQAESVPTIMFPEEYSVIDACAVDVYSQGGTVTGMSREHMPQQQAMAAILRY